MIDTLLEYQAQGGNMYQLWWGYSKILHNNNIVSEYDAIVIYHNARQFYERQGII